VVPVALTRYIDHTIMKMKFNIIYTRKYSGEQPTNSQDSILFNYFN